jgi:hypothetical protein
VFLPASHSSDTFVFEDCADADDSPLYFAEYFQERDPRHARPVYLVQRSTGIRVGVLEAEALNDTEKLHVVRFALQIATPASMLPFVAHTDDQELHIVCLCVRHLISASLISLRQASVLLFHAVLLRLDVLNTNQLAEEDMPPLSIHSIDLASLFQSTLDCLCQLGELLSWSVSSRLRLWLLFNGRVLHLVDAACFGIADPSGLLSDYLSGLSPPLCVLFENLKAAVFDGLPHGIPLVAEKSAPTQCDTLPILRKCCAPSTKALTPASPSPSRALMQRPNPSPQISPWRSPPSTLRVPEDALSSAFAALSTTADPLKGRSTLGIGETIERLLARFVVHGGRHGAL